MKKYLSLSALIAMLAFSSSAYAGRFMFGSQDTIKFLANTTMPGPGESHLYLGHRTTTKSFLLPYNVESNGLVLGISGESKKYMPLPSGPLLEELQQKGFLPKPLPPTELSWFDYIFGYSLWLAIFSLVGIPILKNRLFRSRT